MSKPKLGYLLFDLPSDHEIEGALATECKVIESLIHNRGLKARIKRVCVASKERFSKYPTYRYRVQFVHLACHGGKKGIGLLDGEMLWADVAKQITRHLHPLAAGRQRIMIFSCCHSKDGFDATKSELAPYFSGAYHFRAESIAFSKAITTWTMFYLKKKIENPHEAIVDPINNFIDEEVLVFRSYE